MSYWNELLRIGDRTYPRFIGGPLDGITDSPFRRVVRTFSQNELLYTEMRHVASVANDKGRARTLDFLQVERPLNFQVSASSTDFIEAACERIVATGVDAVDLNIGCPARLVIGTGAGSAMMADIPRLTKVLRLFRACLPIPFTVKMRAGFKHKNALEVAKVAQNCGVDAIAIHHRLQTQFFTGVPDYDLVAQVKQVVTIPVIFSGGVVNWQTAKAAYERTGVDGFLIGRGLWSRPWKLKELHEYSLGLSYVVDQATMLAAAQSHFKAMLDFYGPRGLYAFRKHLPFYIKGKPTAALLRTRLMVSKDSEEIEEGLRTFFGI